MKDHLLPNPLKKAQSGHLRASVAYSSQQIVVHSSSHHTHTHTYYSLARNSIPCQLKKQIADNAK